MARYKKVFLIKALVMQILLMLSSTGIAQMMAVSNDRAITAADPYCGDDGYVKSALGIADGCVAITVANPDQVPANVSDWILIELRTTQTVVARKPAFLLNSGYVVDAEQYQGNVNCDTFDVTDTTNCPLVQFSFDDDVSGVDLYAVVRHINHLDIISEGVLASTTTESVIRYFYDFTESDARGGFLAAKKVRINEGERNAMYVGDVNGDTNINAADYLRILDSSRTASDDINFDGMVNESDITDYRLRQNLGRASQLR